jgi:outer membrane autotransporter protein
MKKSIFFTFLVLFVCIEAGAQIEKGRVLAGGSIGFSFQNYKSVFDGTTTDETKTTSFSLSPRAGYFITDAIAVGAGLNLSLSSSKYDDDDKYNGSSIFFSPFVRYYLPQRLFGQFEIGIGSSKDKWTYVNDDDEEYKYKSFFWSLGVGYAYFLNDNVSVEPMVSYNAATYTDRDNTDDKDKYGNIMLQIGFNIYLDFE